jgi:hypothetical protein
VWEYKQIRSGFPWDDNEINGVSYVQEDGKNLPVGTDILAKINDLGSQGWELISVTAYSDELKTWTASNNSTLGPFRGQALNRASTGDRWVIQTTQALNFIKLVARVCRHPLIRKERE